MDHKNKIWLETQYVREKRSIEDIAISCNVTKEVIISYLNQFDIFRSLPSCIHSKYQCPKCYESEKIFKKSK